MYYLNKSPTANYFPNQDTVLHIENLTPSLLTNPSNDKLRQNYEFLPYHPVSVSSEMVGTTIEELLMHNFPTKNSWENSRLCNFPEVVIMRLNHRSHVKYILIRAKVNRPIPSLDLYIGDGVCGNFNDTKYIKVASASNITEESSTIKADGIGNFIKLVFTKGNPKTQENPFGQISLAQLKIFGKLVNHLVYLNEGEGLNDSNERRNNNIDQILIQNGFPINDEYNLIQDQNYEIAPVDEETKITIRDLLEICRKAQVSKDYEILRKIKDDIKKAFYLGNEILNCDRKIKVAKEKEDFDTCIQLRKKKESLCEKRDNIDVIYETSRYEKMILMQRPSTADLLAQHEYNRKMQEELIERERLERERRELERRERERRDKEERDKRLQDEKNRENERFRQGGQFNNIQGGKRRKRNDVYIPQVREREKKEEFLDELQYNQGDKDLEPFFVPRAKDAGGLIPPPDINKLRRALRQGILTVFGVRLFSSLIGDDWKMREAAVRAFRDFIENELPQRYLGKTYPLFQACIEVCKYTADDKVIQIYLEGLKILQICLAPPICGNDIEPTFIQKSVKYFLPIYIKKISEFNDKQRDLTMKTIIDIFRHPALNVGELVKACLDIVENNNGVTPDKQPWNILLARLEIILHILDEYGIDESLWDWYNVLVELIIPSLFHQKPDCRLVAEEIIVILYKFVGGDIRNIINDLNNLKPNLKEKLNKRMNEVDIAISKESNQNFRINNASQEYKNASKGNLEPIIETTSEK